MKYNKQIFDLNKKTILVTGAAGILGYHLCHGLAAFGAKLILVDVNHTACEALANELKETYHTTAYSYGCNITDAAQIAFLFEKIEGLGPVNVLFNHAASKGNNLSDFFKPVEDFSFETWREISAVNIDAMFLMAQAIGRHFKKYQVAGSIIQTASIYGVVAPDQRIYLGSEYMGQTINTPAVYSATKAAVLGLTRYLAAYWAADNIRVNAISPGGVESGQNEVFKRNYAARVPLGRMGRAEELIGAAVYLASDASSYMTGQNLVIDGGLSVW